MYDSLVSRSVRTYIFSQTIVLRFTRVSDVVDRNEKKKKIHVLFPSLERFPLDCALPVRRSAAACIIRAYMSVCTRINEFIYVYILLLNIFLYQSMPSHGPSRRVFQQLVLRIQGCILYRCGPIVRRQWYTALLLLLFLFSRKSYRRKPGTAPNGVIFFSTFYAINRARDM